MLDYVVGLTLTNANRAAMSHLLALHHFSYGGVCLVDEPVRKTCVPGQSNQIDEGDPVKPGGKEPNDPILEEKELVFVESRCFL